MIGDFLRDSNRASPHILKTARRSMRRSIVPATVVFSWRLYHSLETNNFGKLILVICSHKSAANRNGVFVDRKYLTRLPCIVATTGRSTRPK